MAMMCEKPKKKTITSSSARNHNENNYICALQNVFIICIW